MEWKEGRRVGRVEVGPSVVAAARSGSKEWHQGGQQGVVTGSGGKEMWQGDVAGRGGRIEREDG
jgi:hypothetical protein